MSKGELGIYLALEGSHTPLGIASPYSSDFWCLFVRIFARYLDAYPDAYPDTYGASYIRAS